MSNSDKIEITITLENFNNLLKQIIFGSIGEEWMLENPPVPRYENILSLYDTVALNMIQTYKKNHLFAPGLFWIVNVTRTCLSVTIDNHDRKIKWSTALRNANIYNVIWEQDRLGPKLTPRYLKKFIKQVIDSWISMVEKNETILATLWSERNQLLHQLNNDIVNKGNKTMNNT